MCTQFCAPACFSVSELTRRANDAELENNKNIRASIHKHRVVERHLFHRQKGKPEIEIGLFIHLASGELL